MRRIVVISDLHLGAGKNHPLEEFHSGQQLETLLGSAVLRSDATCESVTLLVLGDAFDLWQVALHDIEYQSDNAGLIDLTYSSTSECARLERILDGHTRVMSELSRLTAQGTVSCVFVPGNHDHSLLDSAVERRLRKAVPSASVTFAASYYDEALGVFAEHGDRVDADNAYEPLDAFGADAVCAGFYFVRLFWNRLRFMAPLLETSPSMWKTIWRYLVEAARRQPSLLAHATRFWLEYRSDARVPSLVSILGGEEFTKESPNLLLTGRAVGGCFFSPDVEAEHAYREAYHLYPEFRVEVDRIRGQQSELVPAHDPRFGIDAFVGGDASLGGYDDFAKVREMFTKPPLGRTVPLDPERFWLILMGHTHLPIVRHLSNGSIYVNTGTWAGRKRESLPAIVIEGDAASTRFAHARVTESEVTLDDWVKVTS